MKKIMILGAGVYQVPLIKKSKENGYYTIVVSIPGDYPGFKIADEIIYLDTTDFLGVYNVAKKLEIDAILTTGTDVALITIGYICDKLNLNGISYEAASLATDKALMKKSFESGGVNTARYIVVRSLAEAQTAAKEIGFPVMIKIVDKSGSRGITKVEVPEMLEEAYQYGLKITNSDHMIVEKYIDAHEIGIDAFVQDGELKSFLPHDKLVYSTERTDIPKGHICPMNVSETLYKELYHQTNLAIRALKLDNCAVNLDAFVTQNDEVYVIEATGRCGATGIPEVISNYTGVDYYQIMLDNALGKKIYIYGQYKKGAVASSLIFSDKTGILKSIEYSKGAFDNSEVIEFDYPIGHRVRKVENGTDRIGMLVLEADSREELLKKIESFEKALRIDVDTI